MTPTNLFMLTATVLQIVLVITIFFFSKISGIGLKLVGICLSFALTSMPDIAHLHMRPKSIILNFGMLQLLGFLSNQI